MESTTSLFRLPLMVFVLMFSRGIRAEEDEEISIVTAHFERIPLQHVLLTLEEIVKDEIAIKDFCYKQFFQDTSRYKKWQNNSDKMTETKEANAQESCHFKPTSCADLFNGGVKASGTYKIQLDLPSQTVVDVYCDMETDGGGWTVFLRRGPYPPHINFSRNWNEYAQGFGNLNEEFWLGNEKIHALTNQGRATVLSVELGDFRGNKRYAKYGGFYIDSVEEKYKLHVGQYEGNAGDGLSYNKETLFATYDHDIYRCVTVYSGGWWSSKGCFQTKLTGTYNNTEYRKGINWNEWLGYKYSLKWAEMKLRSESFDPQRVINLC